MRGFLDASLMMPTSILTFHSQNIAGADHASNDHVALRQDLAALHDAGYRIISLDHLLEGVAGEDAFASRQVVLTFDDGCDFDVRDIDWPGHGLQRSFLGIMEDFAKSAGAGNQPGLQPGIQPGLHATTFVIASQEARDAIDTASLLGKDWMSHSWWASAQAHPMLSVGNHSWDHNHRDFAGKDSGSFRSVDDHAQCLAQVVRSAAAIEAQTGIWPHFFAYPFGESSPYLRDKFFPDHPEVHGCRAAVGTEAGFVTADSNIWNLPRFVCGRDWDSAESLIELLDG